MADIVTPNLKEASALLGGVRLETVDDMRAAAKWIHDMGPRLVLGNYLTLILFSKLPEQTIVHSMNYDIKSGKYKLIFEV